MLDPNHEKSLFNRARKWMEKSPRGAELFRQFSQDYKLLGRLFGINLIRELVRYELNKERAQGRHRERFSCNALSPFIARLLIQEDPELGKFIECRATKCGS